MGYKAPFVLRDLIEGKTVEPVLYTGLDECTQENVDSCPAKEPLRLSRRLGSAGSMADSRWVC